MKILAIGASTSSTSINRQFAAAVAGMVPGGEVTVLDLCDYSLPLFSVDEEEANGVPQAARAFLEAIRGHDALVVSLAEHNGSYAAGFKNLYDWASRVEYEVWGGKPMLLLSTSPGGRGGATVLAAGAATFPRMGAEVAGTLSLPLFSEHFAGGRVTDAELAAALEEEVAKFASALS